MVDIDGMPLQTTDEDLERRAEQRRWLLNIPDWIVEEAQLKATPVAPDVEVERLLRQDAQEAQLGLSSKAKAAMDATAEYRRRRKVQIGLSGLEPATQWTSHPLHDLMDAARVRTQAASASPAVAGDLEDVRFELLRLAGQLVVADVFADDQYVDPRVAPSEKG